MATWSKKTYKMVAEHLRAVQNVPGAEQAARILADGFRLEFEADNPAFDSKRFYAAVFGETVEDRVNARLRAVAHALDGMQTVKGRRVAVK